MNDAENLLAQAIAAVNAGELKTAAERFERAAAILTTVRPADAVSALESAARLRLMSEEPLRAADAVARAKKLEPDSARVARLHAEVVDVVGDLDARRNAWQDVLLADEARHRQHAHIQLAAIERAAGQHPLAASHFEAAVQDVTPSDAPTLTAELWLEVSISKAATGDTRGAEVALLLAEAALRTGDDDDDEVRGMRGRMIGQRGVIALGAGDLEAALTHGEAARASAVERADVLTYVAAASLIAMVHEQAGRLVDAYDTYVRARESLGQLLGEEGKALVQPAVRLFEERLGPERFKTTWDAWVAKRRAERG